MVEVDRRQVSVEEGAKEVLRAHAKSFRWASVFLNAQRRTDAAIAYAFCRFADDLVDETDDLREAEQALDDLTRMLDGEIAPSPLVRAYMDLAHRQNFGLTPARDLIKGMRSDLQTVRVKNDEELLLYCYRAAGTVGLMMCGILGVRDKRALGYAVDLGVAMQLTNICRDVLEDAKRGRVYLPARRLLEKGFSQERLVSECTDRKHADKGVKLGVASVVQDLLLEAERRYERASAGYEYIPAKPRLSIMIAANLYRQIGVLLGERQDFNPLLGRVSVETSKKVRVTLGATMEWAEGLWLDSKQRLSSSSGTALLELSQTLSQVWSHAVGADTPEPFRSRAGH